jgi:hypothetical protein
MVIDQPHQKQQIKKVIADIVGRDIPVEVVCGAIKAKQHKKENIPPADKAQDFDEFIKSVSDYENIKIID